MWGMGRDSFPIAKSSRKPTNNTGENARHLNYQQHKILIIIIKKLFGLKFSGIHEKWYTTVTKVT